MFFLVYKGGREREGEKGEEKEREREERGAEVPSKRKVDPKQEPSDIKHLT